MQSYWVILGVLGKMLGMIDGSELGNAGTGNDPCSTDYGNASSTGDASSNALGTGASCFDAAFAKRWGIERSTEWLGILIELLCKYLRIASQEPVTCWSIVNSQSEGTYGCR
jgi:hypothetical protein